jgi:hypothetical protein
MFIVALFIIAKLWKQPRCPTNEEWIKKWSFYVAQAGLKLTILLPPSPEC